LPLLLPPLKLQLPQLAETPRVAMNQLTSSRQQLRLVQVDVAALLAVLVLVLELELELELEATPSERLQLELLPQVDWETSTSYEITPNSSNFDK
jgi:hypothetical protein